MLVNLKEYCRPADLAGAAERLRAGGAAILAGGTELLGREDHETEAVIDLAPLRLDYIRTEAGLLRAGAMTTLERLAAAGPALLARAIRQAAPATIRAAATLGGTLAGEKGGEEIPTALLALGARITLAMPSPVEVDLEHFLARKAFFLAGTILTEVAIPTGDGVGTGFAFVSRSPADRAIVCAAAAGDRVAVGGAAPHPRLCRADDLWADAPSDHRGSAGYRRTVAPILVRRALAEARGEVAACE